MPPKAYLFQESTNCPISESHLLSFVSMFAFVFILAIVFMIAFMSTLKRLDL